MIVKQLVGRSGSFARFGSLFGDGAAARFPSALESACLISSSLRSLASAPSKDKKAVVVRKPPQELKRSKAMKLAGFDSSLKGMKTLDRDRFKQKVKIPAIRIRKHEFNALKKALRQFALELTVSTKKLQDIDDTYKYVLLDPAEFELTKLSEETKRELLDVLASDVSLDTESKSNDERLAKLVNYLDVELGYEDYKFDDIMRAIIPDELLNENVNVKGYSVIGHIAHFNLRDKILEYKHMIGQVLLDKIAQIRTVVNKLNEIDNTYRNFAFEILAGEPDTVVTCKENSCEFTFDFANVYWNPRLSTEHERVVKMLNEKDVVYDVFAGVGPFSVPAAAARGCVVLANDLNPSSYKYLVANYDKNSRSKSKKKLQELRAKAEKKQPLLFDTDSPELEFDPARYFYAFNLDGREFIRKKVKPHLIETINYRYNLNVNRFDVKTEKYYVLMNLPALSVEFLDAFNNLYSAEETELIRANFSDQFLSETMQLHVNCYHFAKTEPEKELPKIQERIRDAIYKKPGLKIESKFVRKVAPNKDMHCTMFTLNFDMLLYNAVHEVADGKDEQTEPPSKIQKTE